jgi:hypothetical protein
VSAASAIADDARAPLAFSRASGSR